MQKLKWSDLTTLTTRQSYQSPLYTSNKSLIAVIIEIYENLKVLSNCGHSQVHMDSRPWIIQH